MSVWTHVTGVVRIDSIRIISDDIPNFDNLFGKEWTFDDMWDDESIYKEFETNPDAFMPSGSEGSLTKSIWINPDRSEMASYVVTIFGDLRDYDTPEDIISWFKNCCKDIRVRQAIITVDGGRNPIIYRYEEDNNV